MYKITVKDRDDIPDAAERILEIVPSDAIVAFYGEMGAGKTTLIREMCLQMGVTDNVTSPTFAIVNEYHGGDGASIYHFDCYRLNKTEEALDFGCEEYFDSGEMCLIEWPEKIAEILPNRIVTLKINVIDDDEREITITLPE